MEQTNTTTLNMGPSHPATHGTVRLVVDLEGEKVVRCDPQVGWLHRGFEKMCESVRWQMVMPYTDRLNYVSPLCNNFGWALTVEKMLGITIPERAQYLRVIGCEISRIVDHSICIAATAMEMGAFSAFLYIAEAREFFFDLLEEMTGARVTHNYGRFGGVARDVNDQWFTKLDNAIEKAFSLYDDVDKLLTNNRMFKDRLEGVGVISQEDAVSWGITGPFLRGTGIPLDLRKTAPYWVYDRMKFHVPVGNNGDVYDRYLVRFEEMRQSVEILKQARKQIEAGPIIADDHRINYAPKDDVYKSIQGTIRQFMITIDGPSIPPGDVYGYVEAPNGELGFYVVSDGTDRAYRVRCRPPSWYIMQALEEILPGHLIADIVPIFGSVNMIGGECDR